MRRTIPAINAATGGSMNNRRSYLDSINAGRRRRASTSLEEISSTLDELESRIRSPHEERLTSRREQRLTGESSYFGNRDNWAHARDDRSPRAGGFDSDGVAQELSALRRDLRDQMGAGLRREFAALKSEIETAMQTSGPAGQVAELGVEFERLSAMIHKLASQSDDRQVNLLRLEMEQVKNALGKLAREDTVQSFDRRWDEFDQRWTDIANQVSNVQRDPALQALSARLEQIGDAVNALPTSVALRSLEEKMKLLAATVDQFAHHQDRIAPDALDAIEERLDEISRAVAASTSVAHPVAFDPEPFQRIEARISGLTRQMEEAAQTNPAAALVDQLSALSHRVEDISHRVELPEHVIEKLSDRIDSISYKLDQAPGRPDLDEVFHNLENRFASLSAMLEQRHDDALVKGQNLFRDLERRLDSVAISVESGSGAPSVQDARLMEAMEARFADLATRLDRQPAAPADEAAIRALEARIETMSSKIEASVLQPGVDKKLIRSLETQIADLAAHLSRPAEPAAAIEDIRPRLDKIEEAVAAAKQDVLEAARQAAEEAVRRFAGSGSGPDGALVAGLADDLKSLEALTRKSDDRNAKTFEAIHDTLLKIVGRLGAIENGDTGPQKQAAMQVRETLLGAMQTPSLQPSAEAMPFAGIDDNVIPAADEELTPKKGYRTAAAAAAEAAADAVRSDAAGANASAAGGRRSMLSGLTRALSGRKGKKGSQSPENLAGDMPVEPSMEAETPAVELDAPLDPVMANQPLEPGTGAPDLNAIMKRVRDERGEPARGKASVETAKADFIAAARRAAQAAAAEAEIMKRNPATKTKSGGFSLGGLLKSRRKPVLMGVAAILMALAGLQIGKSFIGGSAIEVAKAPAPAPTAIVAEAVTIEDAKPLPAQPVRVAGEAPAPSTARAAIAAAPERAEDVSTNWLDVETTASAPQAPAAAAPTQETEEAAESQTPPEPTEEQIAAIPVEAGPVALREAAAAGDPKALFEIGNRYAGGRGVPEDMAAAAQWYEQAADEGLAPAQYRIGNLYEKGIGVQRDVAAAKTWYQLAAAQGNASAMHNLAVLFAMGADGTTDNESAARWFGEAAERGVKDSQFNLGILAAKGVGMEQNLEEAYQWFALLAKAGDKDAAEKRDEVATALRPEQLENARAAVELWRAKPVDPEANTVEVPDSWSEGEDVTASVDMKQAVRNIQQILNKNGYSAGPADGVMGAKTKTAIASFQKDNGMAATGEVDEPLVHALLERR
jgi:localization factor PodJL